LITTTGTIRFARVQGQIKVRHHPHERVMSDYAMPKECLVTLTPKQLEALEQLT